VPFNEISDLPLEVRAQQAIGKSIALICRTDSLLRRLDNETFLIAGEDGVKVLQRNGESVLNWVVDAALQITKASKANFQIFDSSRQALQIVAQAGFDRPFLDYFDCVYEEGSACATALKSRGRVIIEDVTASNVFHPDALEIMLDAKVRAVQSTPLIGRSGAVLGMLSTHWNKPCRPGLGSLALLDLLAGTVANWLERSDYAHSNGNRLRPMLTV
jgi:hypothetical protein